MDEAQEADQGEQALVQEEDAKEQDQEGQVLVQAQEHQEEEAEPQQAAAASHTGPSASSRTAAPR